jgi:hypothetical protein
MKITLSLVASISLLTFAALVPAARAESIATFTSTIGVGASTQLGRLSRSGVQQDWNGGEAYPGVFNPTTPYSYHTYTFNSSLFTGAPYVDISIFDELNTASFFISAYAISYNSTNLKVNWLGDEGGSGNFFGSDARYFDVILPVGDSLVLVASTVGSATTGLADPFDIAINAYSDTMYDDPTITTPTTVPEPSTLLTLGTGLVGLATAVRRRVR